MSLTPEQLEVRKRGIGGSEVAALLGLDRYRTPHDLWLLKTRGGETSPNFNMERGNFLESGIVEWWCHRRGGRVVDAPSTLFHATLPHVFATPDRLVQCADGLVMCLSIKAPGYFAGKKWGGEVQAGHYAQLQYEMAVLESLGRPVHGGELAAPICDDLVCFPVPYEPEVGRALCERANAWFLEFVVGGIEPGKQEAA